MSEEHYEGNAISEEHFTKQVALLLFVGLIIVVVMLAFSYAYAPSTTTSNTPTFSPQVNVLQGRAVSNTTTTFIPKPIVVPLVVTEEPLNKWGPFLRETMKVSPDTIDLLLIRTSKDKEGVGTPVDIDGNTFFVTNITVATKDVTDTIRVCDDCFRVSASNPVQPAGLDSMIIEKSPYYQEIVVYVHITRDFEEMFDMLQYIEITSPLTLVEGDVETGYFTARVHTADLISLLNVDGVRALVLADNDSQ